MSDLTDFILAGPRQLELRLPPAPVGADLDCQRCGACCIAAGAVPVYPDDTTPRGRTRGVRGRMGYTRDEAGSTREMKQHLGGRCQALDGVIGKNCRCTIYARRPRVCREFTPGSPGCEAAREQAAYKMRDMRSKPRGYGENWRETV